MRRIRQHRSSRFKRRKQKYTWFPTLGQESTITVGEGQQSYGVSYISGLVEVSGGPAAGPGPTDIYVTPIVPDQTFQVDDAQEESSTLRDFTEGQDWLLKRIVGSLQVMYAQISHTTQDQSAKFCTVGAAFFVARADEDDPNIPAGKPEEYDPLALRQIREPWIWRKIWRLQNTGQATLSPNPGNIPQNNTFLTAGNSMSPDIDSKVARRIRREERLWFVVNAYGSSAWDATNDGAFANSNPLYFTLDYRILGQMRKSTNRSTF